MADAGAGETRNVFRSALERNEFVCTAELVLGRDHSTVEAEDFVQDAARESDGIKVISLTDLPGGNPALPPEAFVSYVLDHGLTPIAHLTGKDGNRAELEARLHALARLGAENILALTGDAQKEAFAGKAKPVFDLDSVLILSLVRVLRDGIEYSAGARTQHTSPFNFFAGAVVNPFKVLEPDLMMQLYKLRLKVAAGAQFVITQIGFNLRKLHDLKLYMEREGIGHIPVLANVYVPTGKIARMMRTGEIPGCHVTDEFVKRLEAEKKPARLERAALMVAAAKGRGFAGAHIGGFGLGHGDFRMIVERAEAIGADWRGRMDELIFESPGDFYLFGKGPDGLSEGTSAYQTPHDKPRATVVQRLSEAVYEHFIQDGSVGARFFAPRLKSVSGGNGALHKIWERILAPASLYRKATLGCVGCGDCLQDHLNYVGCSMRWCYKELRNGPCGGSQTNGNCEVHRDFPCLWNLIYQGTLAMGDDPEKFARMLIPPRDWRLDRTNALANRFAGVDNFPKRRSLPVNVQETNTGAKAPGHLTGVTRP